MWISFMGSPKFEGELPLGHVTEILPRPPLVHNPPFKFKNPKLVGLKHNRKRALQSDWKLTTGILTSLYLKSPLTFVCAVRN
jgi:hypothetical protein